VKLCASRRRYVPAIRLYADAFDIDPKLADDMTAQHRYDAACYAALAASGQRKDDEELDDKQRLRWRKQALDWLRADLGAYEKLQESGKGKDPISVPQRLGHWQHDRDLAGLRDQEAVAKLPAEERQACQKLWADVDALMKKAQ
jgi:hypothetical protein